MFEDIRISSFLIGSLFTLPLGYLEREDLGSLWKLIPILGGIFNGAMVNHIIFETEIDYQPNGFIENLSISFVFGLFLGAIFGMARYRNDGKARPGLYFREMIFFGIWFSIVINLVNQWNYLY